MARSSDVVLNRQRRVHVDIAPLRRFAERVRAELGFPADSVAVRLVSDAAMRRLNWTFRGKRASTDVLSFPARAARRGRRTGRRGGGGTGEYIGDIAISPETARRNARGSSRALRDELQILVLHGMIHLAGYDHETDRGEMQELETSLRSRLGLPPQ